jgi:hypothetical protein
MTMASINDETLMAYADGQLDEASAREVAQAIAQDEGLAKRVSVFKRTAQAVKEAVGPAPAVSDDLLARVQASIAKAQASQATKPEATPVRPALPLANDQPIAQRFEHTPPANQSSWRMFAAVGSLAIGVLAFMAGRETADTTMANAPLAGPGLVLTADATQVQQWQDALRSLPSGDKRALPGSRNADTQLQMLASFRAASGQLCREFSWSSAAQSNTINGVACHQGQEALPKDGKGGAWQLTYAAVSQAGEGYQPASAQNALDAYVSSIGGSAVLNAEQEREALASLR